MPLRSARAPAGPRRAEPEPRAFTPTERRLERVLFEAHSHMRDVDGLHAPEALDALCKLLFLKLHDERSAPVGEPSPLKDAARGEPGAYASAARRLYREALAAEERRQGLEDGALARVWGTLELGDAALARCLDQLAPCTFSSLTLDVKGRAFQSVLSPAMRAGMGQYFTPERVGALMLAALAPTPGERTLDPFAGSAHFLALAARRWAAHGATPADAPGLFGIEKSERMMRIAWTELSLGEVARAQLVHGDALGPPAALAPLTLGSCDVVVTNPPFGSVLDPRAIARLGPYAAAAGRAATPLEALALERATAFLRPGGRLGIVLPDGLLGNPRTEHVRRWAAGALAVRAIVSLPAETFVPFGAHVKSSILFARRLSPGEAPAHDRRVFLARLDDVGHDGSGRSTEGHELDTVMDAMCSFFAREGW
jgi:type I restriction enzyme M protein